MSPIAYPTRPELPFDTSEDETLLAVLDFYRATLVLKCAGLSDAQLRQRSIPSTELTLMGLLRHMCEVEIYWFQKVFAGDDVATPFDPENTGVDFYNVEDHSSNEVAAIFENSVAASRATVAGISMVKKAARPPREDAMNLRSIVVHMIEEYARHCGHADLLREAIDGSTGY